MILADVHDTVYRRTQPCIQFSFSSDFTIIHENSHLFTTIIVTSGSSKASLSKQ